MAETALPSRPDPEARPSHPMPAVHQHLPTLAESAPAIRPDPEAQRSSPTPAVQQRQRFPLVYVLYHIWVPSYLMLPNGAAAMPPNVRHVEVASDDAVAASLPPFEVPFLAMSVEEFKRAVMAALGPSRSDFSLTQVLTAADAARKLQWRGNISWPGGPPTSNFDVSRMYKLFGEHAAQAELPKRCRLQLIMENPLRRIGDPEYWMTWMTTKPQPMPSEVYVSFRPSGEPLPPPEHCFVLEPEAANTLVPDGSMETAASGAVAAPPGSLGTEAHSPPSSPGCLLRGYSSSTGDEVCEPEFARASTHASSRRSSHPDVLATSDGSQPPADDDPDAPNQPANGARPRAPDSSPDVIMLDGPPASWVSNTNVRPHMRRRCSSSPEVEVVKRSKFVQGKTANSKATIAGAATSGCSAVSDKK
ncbi:hypothetical protein PGT21_021772 [Puccinia graminis f. sp. tritici]|uniref:Uncharacterized protein n=1 Tax=Puccinia graminis f. sp. tritici TaxID=56615 RepID=A0A5B0N158_PUCGR|nr:hypothetical protein PGT21_021772 [Puccinia graminis f. sp. tritici]KAA1124096.1 hypothetical protein PGTUg99_027095 [Puccinia graminis f. sp. tritici]